jgi:tryptophan 2,3-dioxygenase
MVSHPENQTEHLPDSIHGLLNTPYAEYLGLDQLFSIQNAESVSAELHHPEEVIFRSVHLSSELWLRLAGYEIERATAALAPENVFAGARLVRRSRMSLDRVIEATRMLETMPAADYHIFRVHLGTASGLQSPGYAYVRRECRTLATRLDDILDDDQLIALYTGQRDDPLYDFCEGLLDLDATLDRFRTLHLQIAQRFLGETTQGTGGQGIPYLRENLAQRLFPRLWALRGRIAEASGAAAYGYGVPDHNSE